MKTTTTPTTTPTEQTPQYIDVRVNPTSDIFLFDYDPNKLHIGLYVKETVSIHFDTRYQYFINYHSTCANVHVTMDQWDRFNKRLLLLAAPIKSKVSEQIDISTIKRFTIKRPDNTILMGRCPNDPIPSIEMYVTESEYYNGVLSNSTDEMIQYDPQLDEYITRFMTELTDTMNEWLNLK